MAGVLAGVLAATGIGVLLTLPILLAMAVVGLVGSAHGAVYVGSALAAPVGAGSRWTELVVGSLALAVVGLVPLLGALVTGAVAAFGIGGLLLRFTRGPPGDRSPDASDPF